MFSSSHTNHPIAFSGVRTGTLLRLPWPTKTSGKVPYSPFRTWLTCMIPRQITSTHSPISKLLSLIYRYIFFAKQPTNKGHNLPTTALDTVKVRYLKNHKVNIPTLPEHVEARKNVVW
ncbi:hypothetical protein GJ744_004684 [Endocarpon pusillum]|uniref:Uncharacterized protein n=1 Tax=Endocarpon pusillum TaxID=364733 RepID=A0A8H7A9G4_9EURO|nr:hypothetical protein GJ744_004684 [Endocarpon pusillum]